MRSSGFYCPRRLGRGRLLGPLWFTKYSGCGNEKLVYIASLTHTDMQTCTQTHLDTMTGTLRLQTRTHTHTHTHRKHHIRIPGRFDLPAAVMSLVVKLLFSFNIVYRHKHLLEGTLICPALRYTVLPMNAISARSTPAGHRCH